MDILFEQKVTQNAALAAETIWQAVVEAYTASGRRTGISIPLAMLILPLTFHQRTARALAGKTKPAALYKALADDREITVGLQGRMQALAPRTYAALAIGFRSGLIRLDASADWQLIPGRKSSPFDHGDDDVKTIISAAKRVGQAFAEMSPAQISTQLKVHF